MEILARQTRNHHLHIVFGAERKKALDIGVGVFGTHAFVAVGEQHDQPAKFLPFAFGTRDKLIDDRLGAVYEVTELSFPDHEIARVGGAESIFESKHRQF